MDYLKKPLRSRLAMRKETGNAEFCAYAPAYGGIWTNEGNPLPTGGNRQMFGWELRLAGYADSIVNLRHNGWYVDEHCDDVCRGVVYRLPGGRGFLAGHDWPWDDSVGSTVEAVAYETPEQAARVADRMAEIFAEQCREDALKQEEELVEA